MGSARLLLTALTVAIALPAAADNTEAAAAQDLIWLAGVHDFGIIKEADGVVTTNSGWSTPLRAH